MFETLKELLEKKVGRAAFKLSLPEFEEHGHLSTNAAFALAAQKGISPLEAAEEIKNYLQERAPANFFAQIKIAPPGFINLWLNQEPLMAEFLRILAAGKDWGRGQCRRRVVIDYSHPNIAKPMSVAHLRSTIIGHSLYSIFKFRGWEVIGDNHLGDWGKQFGVLIAAFKEVRKMKKRGWQKPTVEDLLQLYVDYSKRLVSDATLDERAREETRKLQAGDPTNLRLWRQFYRVSLREFERVYRLLGVKFDYYLGESFYAPLLPKVVGAALRQGVAKRSEGAVIIPLDEANLPPYLIQKSDGSYLYSTTDIAAVWYRFKKFRPDLILYVVDNSQSLHFAQLFASIRKLGWQKKEQLVHVKFGLVLGEDLKKLSTRAGRHLSLLAVIEEAVSRAEKVVQEKQPQLDRAERNKIARVVGIGALKYNDLSQNRLSDIVFDWEKMLSLESNSAPYLQYTYVRLKSILRKAKRRPALSRSASLGPAETKLVLKLAYFPEVLEEITENYFPHYLANYLYQLAKMVNSFYEKEPVLRAERDTGALRLNLVRAAALVLKSGLNLLGIKTVEQI